MDLGKTMLDALLNTVNSTAISKCFAVSVTGR